MKYVTVLTIRDLFTKVSSPLGSSVNRCAGSSPVTRTSKGGFLTTFYFLSKLLKMP